MKRDMELVRAILMKMEDCESAKAPKLALEGFSPEQVGYHVLIMMEAGLLVGVQTKEIDAEPSARPVRLTWEGHDFVAACREEGRWQKTKAVANQIGGMTLDVFKQILTQIMLGQVSDLV